MFKRLTWMIVGAGVALWGRKRSIDAYNEKVPAPMRNTVASSLRSARASGVAHWIKSFLRDVTNEQRRRQLHRELEKIPTREQR